MNQKSCAFKENIALALQNKVKIYGDIKDTHCKKNMICNHNIFLFCQINLNYLRGSDNIIF